MHGSASPALMLRLHLQQELSSSWDGRPFRRNRHRPKSGGGCCALSVGGAGSPSNTMAPGPTSAPSGILIHPTVRPQYTNVIYRQTGQTDRTSVQGPV